MVFMGEQLNTHGYLAELGVYQRPLPDLIMAGHSKMVPGPEDPARYRANDRLEDARERRHRARPTYRRREVAARPGRPRPMRIICMRRGRVLRPAWRLRRGALVVRAGKARTERAGAARAGRLRRRGIVFLPLSGYRDRLTSGSKRNGSRRAAQGVRRLCTAMLLFQLSHATGRARKYRPANMAMRSATR